jgi:hypothetical protein
MTHYGKSEMHIAGLLVGLFHYSLAPITLLFGLSFNVNQSSNICFTGQEIFCSFSLLLFLYYSKLQFDIHKSFYNIKIESLKPGVENHYCFPTGDNFKSVCCPHYYAEVMIYVSFTLLSVSIQSFNNVVLSFSWSILMMNIWVVLNLGVVASRQFDWYKVNFPEEFSKKKEWKRMIPYLW